VVLVLDVLQKRDLGRSLNACLLHRLPEPVGAGVALRAVEVADAVDDRDQVRVDGIAVERVAEEAVLFAHGGHRVERFFPLFEIRDGVTNHQSGHGLSLKSGCTSASIPPPLARYSPKAHDDRARAHTRWIGTISATCSRWRAPARWRARRGS